MASIDPYRAPTGPKPVAGNSSSLELGRTLSFVFESPQWMMNLLWSALGAFFSSMIVGQLVLFGYQMQIVISSQTSPDRTYPDFDVNKIGDYLLRGLWVWLAQLIVGLIYGVLAMFIFLPIMILSMALGVATENGGEPNPIAVITFFVIIFGTSLLMSLCAMLVITPVAIRVGLTGNLSEAFQFQWHLDFVRRIFGQLILGAIFLVLSSVVLTFLGMLLCFVGIFPALGWFYLAQAQLYAQLYRLYLQRGGTPIQLVPLSGSI